MERARRWKHRCPLKDDLRQGVHPLGSGDKRLHHFSICGGQDPSAAEGPGRAEGGNKVQVSSTASAVQGGGAEGNPDAEPNDALGVAVHACVWSFYVILLTVFYYSYTYRNKNSRGGGREIQGGRDICTPVANSRLMYGRNQPILHSNYKPEKKNTARWSESMQRLLMDLYSTPCIWSSCPPSPGPSSSIRPTPSVRP